MATIQPGTGGTFKATTVEGRLVEVICYLQLQESITAKNPSGRSGVSGDFSIEEFTFTGNYQLPVEQTISPDGSLSISATPYLQDVAILPGSNSPTFNSSTLERYVLEVLMFLQTLERDTDNNPQAINNVTGNYNSDSGLYTGTFSIPVSLSIGGDGRPYFTAQEYVTNQLI